MLYAILELGNFLTIKLINIGSNKSTSLCHYTDVIIVSVSLLPSLDDSCLIVGEGFHTTCTKLILGLGSKFVSTWERREFILFFRLKVNGI